jgi:hypothetical protein
MNDYLVIFSENGARVIKDPIYVKEHKKDPEVLLNPILPHGVPLEYWKKSGNKIGIKINSPYRPVVLDPVDILRKKNKYLKIMLALITLIGIISHVI